MMRTCYTCQYMYTSGHAPTCELYGDPRYACDAWSAKTGIWMPVHEAIPDPGEKVTALIAKIDDIVWTDEVEATFMRGDFVYDDTDREDFQVTHWLRHPKKPGAEEIRRILR